MLVVIAVLVYAVTATTINTATQQAIEQMARDSAGASQGIPFFFQTGQSLVGAMADDEQLRSADTTVRQNRLAVGVRAGAFFDENVRRIRLARCVTFIPPMDKSNLPTSKER
jgi:hypothetical protein